MWDYDEDSRPYRKYDDGTPPYEFNEKAFKEAQRLPIAYLVLMVVVGVVCLILL